MNTTPFALLKHSTAELLTRRASAAFGRWRADWTARPNDLAQSNTEQTTVACISASEKGDSLSGSSDWCQRSLSDGISVWTMVPSSIERNVEQMLFDLNEMGANDERRQPSSIASSVVQGAIEDLLASLISALTDQGSQKTPAAKTTGVGTRLFRRGSGAVLCTVVIEEKAICLLLPREAITALLQRQDRLAGPREATSTLHDALANVPIRLSVEVSQAELTLGYLRTLAVGDVLALKTSVDHAMRVTGPGDTTVCYAHLGTLAGFHAIELIK